MWGMLHSRTTGVIHNFILPRTPVLPKSCACYLFVLRSLPIIFFVSRKVAECRQVWADRTDTESSRGWCLHILRSHAWAFLLWTSKFRAWHYVMSTGFGGLTTQRPLMRKADDVQNAPVISRMMGFMSVMGKAMFCGKNLFWYGERNWKKNRKTQSERRRTS